LSELEALPEVVRELWTACPSAQRSVLEEQLSEYERALKAMGGAVRFIEKMRGPYHREPDFGGFRTRLRGRHAALKAARLFLECGSAPPETAKRSRRVQPKPEPTTPEAKIARFDAIVAETAAEMSKLTNLDLRVSPYHSFGNGLGNATAYSDGRIDLDSRVPLDALKPLLQHESGHVRFRHRWSKDPRPGEFEADFFAGYASAFTQAPLDGFKQFLKNEPVTSDTHGSRQERFKALDVGLKLGNADKGLSELEPRLRVLRALKGDGVPAVKSAFERALTEYRTALAEMKSAVRDVEQTVKLYGQPPDLGGFATKLREREARLRELA
jgi:hypothetical protein